jgi:hypothetical protein
MRMIMRTDARLADVTLDPPPPKSRQHDGTLIQEPNCLVRSVPNRYLRSCRSIPPKSFRGNRHLAWLDGKMAIPDRSGWKVGRGVDRSADRQKREVF